MIKQKQKGWWSRDDEGQHHDLLTSCIVNYHTTDLLKVVHQNFSFQFKVKVRKLLFMKESLAEKF